MQGRLLAVYAVALSVIVGGRYGSEVPVNVQATYVLAPYRDDVIDFKRDAHLR